MTGLSNYYVVEQVSPAADHERALLGVQPTLRTAQQTVPEPIAWREPKVTDPPGPLTWAGRDDQGREYEISLLTAADGVEAPVVPEQRKANIYS